MSGYLLPAFLGIRTSLVLRQSQTVMQPINKAANAMILPMVVAVVVFNLPAGVNMPAAMQWQTGWKRGLEFSPFSCQSAENFA